MEKYKRRIRYVIKQLGDEDPGISVEEFIAIQFFFDKIDTLKAKIAQYRYIDYNTYLDTIDKFLQEEKYCQKNKVILGEHVAQAVFWLLDVDDSGELEPDELLMFDKKVFGQSRDAKAKEDAMAKFTKSVNQVKDFFQSAFGLL